jgi:hypothetical protein
LVLAILGPGTPAAAQELVIPNALSIAEGNGATIVPLSTGLAPSSRFQQVYLATQFPAPVTIYAISFRPDGEDAIVAAKTFDLEIWLSTTSVQPEVLGLDFALNVGPDATCVFDRNIALSTAVTPNVGVPKDFDIVIPLQTPFSFDPVQGNLLLDLRNRSQAGTFLLDANDVVGDGVSLVATNIFDPNTSAESPSGVATSLGVVTRFSLPEPAGSAAAVAVASLASVARWKRDAARCRRVRA